MNVTATAPSANGWLTVYPTGAAFPNASNLNFLAGQTVPNLVVVKGRGPDGQVDITNTDVPTLPHPASGTVHVVGDLIGYFDTTDQHDHPDGAPTHPRHPQRDRRRRPARSAPTPRSPSTRRTAVGGSRRRAATGA